MKKLFLLILIFNIFNSTVMANQKEKQINKDIEINAPIEKVWQVLGHEFASAYKWSSAITHSEALDTETLNGSTCTERGCSIEGFGEIKEKLTAYSNEQHTLTYTVLEGLPGFVVKAENTWKCHTKSNGKTVFELRLKMQTKGFMGWLMGGMLKKKSEKTIDQSLEELKYYIENGQAHPRVLQAVKK